MLGVGLADGLGVESRLDLGGGGVARADVSAETATLSAEPETLPLMRLSARRTREAPRVVLAGSATAPVALRAAGARGAARRKGEDGRWMSARRFAEIGTADEARGNFIREISGAPRG